MTRQIVQVEDIPGIPEAIERNVTDDIDFKMTAIKVHTTDAGHLSSDLVLANLTEGIFQNKVLKFIREQYKLAAVIKEYIQDTNEGAMASMAIINELKTIEIGSRALNGAVLQSVLRHGEMIQEGQEIQLEAPRKENQIVKGLKKLAKGNKDKKGEMRNGI